MSSASSRQRGGGGERLGGVDHKHHKGTEIFGVAARHLHRRLGVAGIGLTGADTLATLGVLNICSGGGVDARPWLRPARGVGGNAPRLGAGLGGLTCLQLANLPALCFALNGSTNS